MKFILFFLLYSLPIHIFATDTNKLLIHLKSGAILSFNIDEKPQVIFEGSVLCINTNRFQISEVKKYTFSKNEELGIESVEEKKNMTLTQLDGEKIAVSVKDTGEAVHVYSANGIEQYVSKFVNNDGEIVIDFAGLLPDIYLITIGSETIKIRKK